MPKKIKDITEDKEYQKITVKITIKRVSGEITISVIRAAITIKFAEGKKLDNGDYYLKITLFGNGVADSFREAVKKMSQEWSGRKIIIDLRSNPG